MSIPRVPAPPGIAKNIIKQRGALNVHPPCAVGMGKVNRATLAPARARSNGESGRRSPGSPPGKGGSPASAGAGAVKMKKVRKALEKPWKMVLFEPSRLARFTGNREKPYKTKGCTKCPSPPTGNHEKPYKTKGCTKCPSPVSPPHRESRKTL